MATPTLDKDEPLVIDLAAGDGGPPWRLLLTVLVVAALLIALVVALPD
jgi:hypothetical protein